MEVGEDLERLEALYESLKRICRLPDLEAEVKRRGSMRAALELFSNHCILFSRLVYIIMILLTKA